MVRSEPQLIETTFTLSTRSELLQGCQDVKGGIVRSIRLRYLTRIITRSMRESFLKSRI